MDGKNIPIATIVIIVAFFVIGLYALTEVNYYSYKNVVEADEINASVVIIPSLGVFEKINNVSIAQGVYIDKGSKIPTNGSVVLFGHRTLQGSPFLHLDQLKKGDIISLEWPGVGEVNYTFNSSKIVSPNYKLDISESNSSDLSNQKLYLITCHPIGSSAERLICTADLSSVTPINDTALNKDTSSLWQWIITIAFLAFGLIISFINPKADRKVLIIVVLFIFAVLVYFCLFPISSQIWADQVGWLNSIMGIN